MATFSSSSSSSSSFWMSSFSRSMSIPSSSSSPLLLSSSYSARLAIMSSLSNPSPLDPILVGPQTNLNIPPLFFISVWTIATAYSINSDPLFLSRVTISHLYCGGAMSWNTSLNWSLCVYFLASRRASLIASIPS